MWAASQRLQIRLVLCAFSTELRLVAGIGPRHLKSPSITSFPKSIKKHRQPTGGTMKKQLVCSCFTRFYCSYFCPFACPQYSITTLCFCMQTIRCEFGDLSRAYDGATLLFPALLVPLLFFYQMTTRLVIYRPPTW